MLRGLTTVSFFAADLMAAKQWYTELLGVAPYFERPGYIEFRLGDYQHELGIIDSRYAPSPSTLAPGGAIVYWHVDDLQGTYKRLLALGAQAHQPIIQRGEGFVTASVVDPFGNILGIMYNAHYLTITGARSVSNRVDETDVAGDPVGSNALAIDDEVLEIVHFRVKPGVDDDDVLAASAETQKWLGCTPGYRKRELSKNDEGQWIDIVHWRSFAEAKVAADQIMQQPCAASFMQLLDVEQVSMFHVERKQYFGATT